MSVAYPPDVLPKSRKDDEAVEMFSAGEPRKISGRPVLNEFGAGFTLKQDVSIDGSYEPKIVWVSRTSER